MTKTNKATRIDGGAASFCTKCGLPKGTATSTNKRGRRQSIALLLATPGWRLHNGDKRHEHPGRRG